MNPQDERSQNGHHVIAPRRVPFDWEKTPLHWIPDEPTENRPWPRSAGHVVRDPPYQGWTTDGIRAAARS